MFAPLFANFERYVSLSEAARSAIRACVRVDRVRKRQYVSQPGQVAQFRNYVARGAFRSFFIAPDGKEHTLQLAVEDWFISDFYSYITQTPGTLFVEALEDGELWRLPHGPIEAICAEHHEVSEYFRRTTERAFAFSRMRVEADISRSAEARYAGYLARYPHIAERVPQYVLASYLGMSAEFLSKIRARRSVR